MQRIRTAIISNNPVMKNNLSKQDKYLLILLLACAFLYRLYFYYGHIFSDDAYYSYLSFTLLKGEFAKDFIGYPVFPLRIGQLGLTAFSFFLFGVNEYSTLIFPMLFSIAAITLTFFLTFELTQQKNTALLAALFMAFLPTDVVFASINFADSPSAFFINLGLFLLLFSGRKQSKTFAVLAGLSFATSLVFKENFFYYGILLSALWLYHLVKKPDIARFIFISLLIPVFYIISEAAFYQIVHGQFLYHFNQIEKNYIYCQKDFFTLGAEHGYASEQQYWSELLKRVFIYNPKSLLLRRFYLFLPLLALLQSYFSVRRKENLLLIFWFIGLVVMFCGFTSSFKSYQPLILHYSWYGFPIFMPMVILSSIFIQRLSRLLSEIAVPLILLSSVIMSLSYTSYFDRSGLSKFKDYILTHPQNQIYTDHLTKYGIDLLDGYPNLLRTKRIYGIEFDLSGLPEKSWVIYKYAHIHELKSQGHQFPDFSILQGSRFKKIFSSAEFEIYEKVE